MEVGEQTGRELGLTFIWFQNKNEIAESVALATGCLQNVFRLLYLEL
jgi:hypothetical protein